eukprot:TRINITY_DN5321_c0_g1_i1.p1 TRINITY_DN5321_c0_g1~~TRINITY_DN5321_c0_g1_i1.p1  ORF type:complete len:190 (+),score=29.94 TRINITY_DN5321_c0_g1_i1:52-621(+)
MNSDNNKYKRITQPANESTHLLGDQHPPHVQQHGIASDNEDVDSGYFPTKSTNIYQDPTPEDLAPEDYHEDGYGSSPPSIKGGDRLDASGAVIIDETGSLGRSSSTQQRSRVVIVTKLKHVPQILECKACGYQGMTLIRKKPDPLTYVCSGVLSLLCLCWIPWCTETCHATQHVCHACDHELGYKSPCC